MEVVIDVRMVVVEVTVLVKFPSSFLAQVELVEIDAFARVTLQFIDCIEEFVVTNLALKSVVKGHWNIWTAVAMRTVDGLSLLEFNKRFLVPECVDSITTEAEIDGAFVGSLDRPGKLQGLETVYSLVVLSIVEGVLCSC